MFTFGCDRLSERKYTSANIKEDSVKKFMSPLEEDIESFQYKSSEPQVIIPEELKQKISLTLNENLSIKTVLCESAKKLNINFQIDPSIDSKIIFQSRKKPFIEILDAICDMADLRYTITNGVVKVVKDFPYSSTYDVQFLNLSKDSENKISIATEISSINYDANSKSIPQESNVVVKAKSNFWSELDDALGIITNTKKGENANYSINKQSGIVTVYANSKIQRDVERYINRVKESNMSQVLIEAKIIEVSLKNEYRRGINWSLLSGRFKFETSFGEDFNGGVNHKKPIEFSYTRDSLSNVLRAIEEFGSVRIISNPRITAMNNQSAILKVAQNHVYFKLNYDKTYASTHTDRTDIAVSSDIKTVPIGFVMFVQPSINASEGTVTLFLRPTITKLSSTVNDPAVEVAMKTSAANSSSYEKSKVPVIEVREVASILKLNDGEIAVLGGFMEARSSKNTSGIPGIKNIPGVGELASSYGIGDEIIELVILIKVKLINRQKQQNAADTRLQRFVMDPRPF
ncbi:MAG: hypothetical protein LBI95_03925 [Holosporales bacterium]|nr:hypothetical protein [Holosporales bacterium]